MGPVVPSLTILLALALASCGDATTSKTVTTPSGATTTSSTATTPAADNTAKNARDDGSTATPLDQGTSETDIMITQAARKAVVADKALSVNGQNVKIITKDGVMVLRGPVASVAERTAIVDLVQKVDGVRVVKNQLEIVSQ